MMNQLIFAIKSSTVRFRTTYLFKRNNGYGMIGCTYQGLREAVKLFRFIMFKQKCGL